ncbi:MAG: hypothetical protein O3A01_03665 [bacterium]|nr:hypothetical protein [bacterium]
MKRFVILCLALVCICVGLGRIADALTLAEIYPTTVPTDNVIEHGWWTPNMPNGSGHYDTSVGFHFWKDHTEFRNAQFRWMHYFQPGLRFNTVYRSNRDRRHIEEFEPTADEIYLEWFGFFNSSSSQLALSAKAGRMRYLRFPYPDIISMYDQVPGIEDLKGRFATGYQGLLLTNEWAHQSGLGWHATNLLWVDSPVDGWRTIENYAFFRWRWKWLEFEGRAGRLAERESPLQDGSLGTAYYVGSEWRGCKVGVLLESLESEGIRTGLLVQFAPSKVTNALGTVRLDYTRENEGFAIQPRLLHGYYGIRKEAPENAVEVGRILVERSMTYWQDGQARNNYEHVIATWGETKGDDLIVVADEQAQYLRIESLVSRVHKFDDVDDFEAWEEQRQGPAQLARPVIYRFYRLKN